MNFMNEYISRHNTFSFRYPNDWELEQEDNLLTVYNNNGVGALNISYYYPPKGYKVNKINELIDYLSENAVGINAAETKQNIIAKEDHVYVDYIDKEKAYWQYWLFSDDKTVIIVTYNCEEPDREKERTVVKQIIETLNIF